MDIAKRQDFGKIFNAEGDHGKTFNSIFSMPNKKDRKFSGASTKRGYGPVFDPMQRNTMSSTVGGAGEASMPAGDGGGAMGESNNEKFVGLLESLRTEANSDQIDMIKKGFGILHENYSYDEIDEISSLEHPDDIERAVYGEEEEEDDIDYEAYDPYVDALLKLIEEHGYWSDNVRNYNSQIPDELDVSTLHMLAKSKMRNY